MKKALLAVFCCTFVLSGCGSSGGSVGDRMVMTGIEDNGMAYEYGYDNMASESYDADSSDEGGTMDTGVIDTEKLVYRGDLSIDTLDFAGSVAAFREMVDEYEGFVENERTSDDGGWGCYWEDTVEDVHHEYHAMVRIPSSRYDDFIVASGSLGSVRSSSSTVENISQQYSTTQTSLEIYSTKYDRYLQFLSKAETVEDMLSIERELTDLEVKLADYKTQLSTMDTDVAYSYVDVDIREVSKRSFIKEEDTFLTRLKETCTDSVTGFLKFCEALLFFFIMNWWYLAAIPALIALAVRNSRKKDAKKNASRMPQENIQDIGKPKE